MNINIIKNKREVPVLTNEQKELYSFIGKTKVFNEKHAYNDYVVKINKNLKK